MAGQPQDMLGSGCVKTSNPVLTTLSKCYHAPVEYRIGVNMTKTPPTQSPAVTRVYLKDGLSSANLQKGLIPILHQSELMMYGKDVMERTSPGLRSM